MWWEWPAEDSTGWLETISLLCRNPTRLEPWNQRTPWFLPRPKLRTQVTLLPSRNILSAREWVAQRLGS